MVAQLHDETARETLAFWRERAEQLQEALDSRIVIEQAKGILAERFALDMDKAFLLLRAAARRNRLKIHDLAAEIVASRTTPQPVLETSQRDLNGRRQTPRPGRT
ncbi:MAG: ANTAR domain-containing protein [Actinobacteria bacterium]|nr:MAG: ANTAR domain-containing protein [Actinomycetota bacterium]